jgi:hypothetical protein
MKYFIILSLLILSVVFLGTTQAGQHDAYTPNNECIVVSSDGTPQVGVTAEISPLCRTLSEDAMYSNDAVVTRTQSTSLHDAKKVDYKHKNARFRRLKTIVVHQPPLYDIALC